MNIVDYSFAIRFYLILLCCGINFPVLAITFKDAFDSALRVDPTVRASRFNQDASNENILIARSRLLPQISLQGSSNQLTQTTIQDVPGSANNSRSFSGPSVNHQLVIRQGFVRPRDVIGLNLAELQAQLGEVKYQSDLSDLWMRVATAWIDVVGAQQLVDAYERPLLTLLESVKQEKTRYKQGEGTKDAVIEAEAQYQFAAATYLQATHLLIAKQKTFEILTQSDSKSLRNVVLNLNPSPAFKDQDSDSTWSLMREMSFDLKIATLQEQMQKARLQMARTDHLPTLDVTAAWSIAKNDATSTQGYRYQNSQIGIQYVLPIYAGGGISAADRQAARLLESSIADRDAVEKRVETDFRVLWSAWIGQIGRVAAGFKLMESSTEQLKATKLAYSHGVKTVMDLASAELAHSRRIADQVNIVMEYQKYTTRLSKIGSFNAFEKANKESILDYF